MAYSAQALLQAYGTGENLPTLRQWENLIQGDMASPLTVVNFFKLRSQADATLIDNQQMSGLQAFNTYAETSVPKVSEVGGHFILYGKIENDFIGNDLIKWDITAIGQYPQREYFLKLCNDEAYKNAFRYRQAAVELQHVYLIDTA